MPKKPAKKKATGKLHSARSTSGGSSTVAKDNSPKLSTEVTEKEEAFIQSCIAKMNVDREFMLRLKYQYESRDHTQPYDWIYHNVRYTKFNGVMFVTWETLNLIEEPFCVLPEYSRATWEIRSGGTDGIGMYATQDIPTGEILLIENPAIIVSVFNSSNKT